MTTPKTNFAGLALIVALCAGVVLGLTSCAEERARTGAETPPAEAVFNTGAAAYKRGDYATALREIRPLAELGIAEAQFNLGLMYYKGQGVPQDHAQAVRWYRPAAWQGNVYAQYNLGIVFMIGQGDIQDYVQAYKFLTIAASRFPPGEWRDNAVNNRDIVAKKMTPAQISEAERLAREWKLK